MRSVYAFVQLLLVTVLIWYCPTAAEGENNLSQTYSPEVQAVISGTLLERELPDRNEGADELKVYLGEIDKVDKTIKKRKFGDEFKHGKKSYFEWLADSEKILTANCLRYNESRHLHEALARVNAELYEQTNKAEYLTRAAEEFIQAEQMGVKHGKGIYANYSFQVSRIASQLRDKNILDKYYQVVSKEFPSDEMRLLWHAQALAALQDSQAQEAFEKALAEAKGSDFDQVISYAEFLLDQKKYEKALQILNRLVEVPSPDSSGAVPIVSYYAHFLKGFVLENVGRPSEAEQEYAKYVKFREIIQQYPGVAPVGELFFQPPAKYKTSSKLQKDKGIKFKEEETKKTTAVRMAQYGPSPYPPEVRSTAGLCASTDYACKMTYYLVWTIEREAVRGGGTTGMGRAVGWNIRARVFNKEGKRICFGETNWCFNYASAFPLAADDSQLMIRYFEVMNTGGYAGLLDGNYTAAAWQIAYDTFYGRVPDPTAGLCPPGVVPSDSCNSYCSTTSYWGAFAPSVSCMEFRAGRLDYYVNSVSGASCYNFVTTSTPAGSFCGTACWIGKGPICARTVSNDPRYSCYNTMYGGFYNYSGPDYGNFCWSFNP